MASNQEVMNERAVLKYLRDNAYQKRGEIIHGLTLQSEDDMVSIGSFQAVDLTLRRLLEKRKIIKHCVPDEEPIYYRRST